MRQVGSFEAKTHLSALLEAVESGEHDQIIITKRGRPIAQLVPIAGEPKVDRSRLIGRIQRLRKRILVQRGTFTKPHILSARDEGRR